MPPSTPIVDPRNFQDIVDEAKRRIPRYCPEWTDHNVADPGVTMIELFAWMTDVLLYRLNKVPERNYLKFLELIGARPHPAVPAIAELTFWLTAPQAETKVIPHGTEIATRQTETTQAVTFTIEEELRILVPKLRHCVVARRQEGSDSGHDYQDLSERLAWERATITVFQEVPKEGDAFYLGFQDNLAGHIIRLNITCETLRAPNINQDDPPLTWEFWNGEKWAALLPQSGDVLLLRQTEAECERLGPRLDDTRGLNRDGSVILVVPRSCTQRELRVGTKGLYACWFRCRAERRRQDERFYDRSPVLHSFLPESIGGTTVGSHAFEVVGETLGRSDGTPGQSLALLNPPVLPRRLDGDYPEVLEVELPDHSYERWTEVEDFADSGPADSHYLIDGLTGEVRFGPRLREPTGQERQYGRVPPKGQQIRITRYRSGGGSVGNVGAGTLVVPKSASDLSYVKWVANLQPAAGGRDRETLDSFKLRGPRLVRTREVAVTRSDFEYLALEASPRVARARCIAATAEEKGGGLHYAQLLLIPTVATTDQYIPVEQLLLSEEHRRDLCRTVRAYLEERCPITTELSVRLPNYRWVNVRAKLVVKARPDVETAIREATRLQIQLEAGRRLYTFIHPITGGPDGKGWPFGKSLTLGDVYPLLQNIDGVEYVEEVRFRLAKLAGGARQLGPDERLIRLAQTDMLCSDEHEIEVIEEA